jgi:hypothetical protein
MGHRMPLGQPQKAIGLESQIEPWLAPANSLLASAKDNRQKNANQDDAENLPRRGERKPRPRKTSCRRQPGLDVRKISSPGGSGEVFLLDIPFYRTRPQLDKSFFSVLVPIL